jgi:catechol 2,3-dioxygenase-like lactoylglutathione lyase family enzyme
VAPFPALTHIAVTVSDMAVSTEWYTRLFGAPPVLDEDEESGAFHHAVFVLGGGTMFGLHTHTGKPPDVGFDERRIGLDHIRSPAPQTNSNSGGTDSTHSASRTAASRQPSTVPCCPSADDIALELLAPPS